MLPLLQVRAIRLHVYAAVDKTRNMEHSGTSRNIPEHEKIKIFFYEKMIN